MNASMPSELVWRLVRAFTNQDKEEIKRLNHIWFHQLKKNRLNNPCFGKKNHHIS